MKSNGFTYIALLIFVAIIALGATALVSTGTLVQRRSAEEELLFIGNQFQTAFRSYYFATPNGQSRYPTSIEALLKDPRYPNPRRYLRQIYADPITGATDWVLIEAPEGGIMGVHSKSSLQPIKVSQFPVDLAHLENKTHYADWSFFYYPQPR